MPSRNPTAGDAHSGATHKTPLEQSCRMLSGRLDNTAQVLAALAASADGQGGHQVERRLSLAAAKIAEVVDLLGDGTDATSPVLGLTPGVPAFHGRNALTSLVDFVSLLSHMGRNGVLEVHTAKGPFTLELEHGHVVFATGGACPGLRLGDVLVEQGALTEEELSLALAEQADGEVLGALLLRTELVTQADLDTALTRQMSQLFGRMHEVGTGFEFVFEEDRKVLRDSHIRQGTAMMLLEGARLLDEGALWRPDGTTPEPDGLGSSWLSDFGEETDEEFLDVDTFRSFVEVLFLEGQLDLACLPQQASQLFTACWREDADLEQAADLIERDPGLCAHLLRAAGLLGVLDVRTTVHRLGITRMRELVLSLTLNARSADAGAWNDVLSDLCRKAAVAADFGAVLGRERLGDEGCGRMLGLLAELGKPVVLGAILEVERECQASLAPSAVVELLEEYHAQVGTWLARHWGFPADLLHALEHSANRGSLQGVPLQRAQIVRLCGDLTSFVCSTNQPSLAQLERLPIFAETGLLGARLHDLLESSGLLDPAPADVPAEAEADAEADAPAL